MAGEQQPILFRVGEWEIPFSRVRELNPPTKKMLVRGLTEDVVTVPITLASFEGVMRMMTKVGVYTDLLSDTDLLQMTQPLEMTDNPLGRTQFAVTERDNEPILVQTPTIWVAGFVPPSFESQLVLTRYQAEIDFGGSIYYGEFDKDQTAGLWEGQANNSPTLSISSFLRNKEGSFRTVVVPCNFEDPIKTLETFSKIRVRFVEKQLEQS